MADDVTQGGDTGAAVEGQAASSDGATTGAGQQGTGSGSQGTAPQEWRIGDQTFKDPAEMHKAALNWQKQFTQVSQKNAEVERNYRASQMIVKTIASDPQLQQEVIRRMQGGQSQQQAVQQTANAHPEIAQLRQQLSQYGTTIEQLQQQETYRQQDYAQAEFKEKHPDLQEKDWTSMAQWIGDNAEWFDKANIAPYKIIEFAYNSVVLPSRLTMANQQGQQQKEQEIQNGKKSTLLGSGAPTAQARAQSSARPKGRLTPAQERDFAQKTFAKNASRG
jgi:hypothetical protein